MNAIAQLVLSDLGPLAFSVLALLFFSSISVWIVFLLKTLSLIRGLYLQKKAIKLLERIPRQEELRLRFAAMPDNPLKDLFETSDDLWLVCIGLVEVHEGAIEGRAVLGLEISYYNE